MTVAPDQAPPVRRRGAPSKPTVSGIETVRATAPDHDRRTVINRSRGRTVLVAGLFCGLFAALSLKLVVATIIWPHLPRLPTAALDNDGTTAPKPAAAKPPPPAAATESVIRARRAMITDRNGEVLALSVPTYNITLDPRALIDPDETAARLRAALPMLDARVLRERLADPTKSLVYVARQVSVRETTAVRALHLPGLVIEQTERRRYPFGPAVAHLIGGVGQEGAGIAGVEMRFNDTLLDRPTPLRLAVDVHVQAVVRDELQKAMTEFSAIGGCGMVMDVRTGELIALVSLPDFDPDQPRRPTDDAYRNRCVYGRYEPGSTFKLQTTAMALDSGQVHVWDSFDASAPLKVGRFTIHDDEPKGRPLQVPEIIAYSSNIGAAQIARTMGVAAQRAWLDKMGLLGRTGVELPEDRSPQFPAKENWGLSANLTIGFGHGIAVTPLAVVMATSAVANGGVLMRPTVLAAETGAPPREGVTVMQRATSDVMRRLMRLVVTTGTATRAEIPGYYIGGKTGTAEKNNGHGYNHNARVSSFMAVFPMNAPRYAVYLMLDEPKATAATHGFATAGMVAAPALGHVIERAAPLLGMQPDTDNANLINAQLAIALQPGRGAQPAAPRVATQPPPPAIRPAPQTTSIPAAMPAQALRQQIRLTVPDNAGH